MSRTALNGPQQHLRDLVTADSPLHERAAAAFKLSEAQAVARNQEKCAQLARRVLGFQVEEWSTKLADAEAGKKWMTPAQLVAFEADGYLFHYNVPRKGDPGLTVVEFCHECGDDWSIVRYIDSLSDLGQYDAHPYSAFICDECKTKLAQEVPA